MKKLYIILLGCVTLAKAQNPEIKTELPTIVPPSPTVAALMKFEEVPVSNYTGVPDISIPLFSSPTASKQVSLNISLNYHPSGVAMDERSSDVGLGWSLFAGGSISRTVRGMPDEIFQTGNVLPGGYRFGIYQDSSSNINHRNTFYQAFENIRYYFEDSADSIPENGFDGIDRLLWDVNVRGAMDAEHDLWQFNFMGKSGRFYIKKTSTNQLEVVPLDDYRVKILNQYGDTTNPYKPISFVIYDESGFKYVFEAVETTTSHSISNTTPHVYGDIFTEPGGISTSATASYSYRSAFHLTEVRDNNGNLLMELKYDNGTIIEKVMDAATTYYRQVYEPPALSIRDFYDTRGGSTLQEFNPYPQSTSNGTMRETFAKKLSEIQVPGFAKIDFLFTQGRLDGNIFDADSAYKFSGIVVKDWEGHSVKKVQLTQDYSTTKIARMVLTEVAFQNSTDTTEMKYQLFYRANNAPDGAASIRRDYWGYFTLAPPLVSDSRFREPDPIFCTTETLQKMVLPTGGCILYDFEPNTYSYIGNTPVNDYDANPRNWDEQVTGLIYDNEDDEQENDVTMSSDNRRIFEIADMQDVTVTIDLTTQSQAGSYFVKLYRYVPENTDPFLHIGGTYIEPGQSDYDHKILHFQGLVPGEYYMTFQSQQVGDFLSANVHAYSKVRNANNFQFLYGGGNRIAKVGFFEDGDTPQTFYQDAGTADGPKREKTYSYNEFAQDIMDETHKSSGSLTYHLPKFDYEKVKRECTYILVNQTIAVPVSPDENLFFYKISTTFNNLSPVRTQGADVGYKNVKVLEAGNGVTAFEYTNSFDHPEPIGPANLSQPFMPTENFDYKRGLPTRERTFDSTGRSLRETVYGYDFVHYLATTGFRTYCPEYDFTNVYHFNNYNDYKEYLDRCGQSPSYNGNCAQQFLTEESGDYCECFCYSGRPREFVSAKFIKEAYGWAKLTSKTTKDYSYVGNTQKIVETTEAFTYNELNKQIATHTTTSSTGEQLKTEYDYHTGNSDVSQNRISEIEEIRTRRNDVLVSKSQIAYTNSFGANHPWLPHKIKAAKGDNALEEKVQFMDYDAYGNPLLVRQPDGAYIYYIWGYNDTQPVAKIESPVALTTLPGQTIDQIKSETAGNNLEGTLQGYFTTLRDALPGAMVTCYTYVPLVGIRSVTDPKGMTTTYEYDAFGRLSAVRDHQGYLLSENEYHYRTN